MKVLMLTANLDLPEAHLMLGLIKLGIKIKLIMRKESPFQEVLQGSGIDIQFWDFKYRLDPKSIFYLRKILKNEKFDIIHTFSARALTSALFASVSMPLKHVTYRGTTGHLSRLDPSSWLSYFHPRVSKIICVSDAVKNYLLNKGVKAGKLERIYKGHEESWYNNEFKIRRKDFGISESTFLVACSANMRPVKGVDLLISAFEFIPEDFDIKAVLIGEIRDPAIEALISDSKFKNRLVLTGFRKDAAGIVAFSNIFCMPSRKREGLPKALIEAMIQGKPVIVTNVGGMPELVKHLEHGLVVPEEDPQAIAKSIIQLYNEKELALNLGTAAKQRILSDFTLNNTLKETFNLYKELLVS